MKEHQYVLRVLLSYRLISLDCIGSSKYILPDYGKRSLAQSHWDDSRTSSMQSIAGISTLCGFGKNDQVVHVHVFNSIVFRRVPQRRTVGKNATVFQSRVIRYISCCEQGSALVEEPCRSGARTTHQGQDIRPRRGSRRESSHSLTICQRPHTETWRLVASRKSVVVQPEHPMAQAARCGCYVGTVTIPAHASSMRRAIAQH